jgi:hypothetical protein
MTVWCVTALAILLQDADPVGAQQYSFFGGFDDGADESLGGLEVGHLTPRFQRNGRMAV